MATQVFTINEFSKYLSTLPKKFESEKPMILKEMSEDIARRIRTRAPQGSSGSLKRDIKATKAQNVQAVTGPRHWSYVNAGVAPMKWLPLEVARAHVANPGSTAGKNVNIPRESVDGWFFAGYVGGAGFVDNAIVSFEQNLPVTINKAINRVFTK
jgi:hypothetical protein